MNLMNELEMLRSKSPNVPVNPSTMAYMPNSTCPIFVIMNGVRIKGKINPTT
jgi:hypothetical protein